MQPIDAGQEARGARPGAQPHRPLGRRPARPRCSGSTEQGVRFTPGGIRKGAAGYDVCFIHPKGNEDTPLVGEGVLIELVQAPPDIISALG